MSEPAEERVTALLAPLREAETPPGDELAHRVTRIARWQRPLRRALVIVAASGGGVVEGFTGLWRGRRAR